MNSFTRYILIIAAMVTMSTAAAVARPLEPASVTIMGESELSVDCMYHFVCQHNDSFDRSVAEAFFVVAERYGVRGDIALCQAILETGWFRFDDGTAVTPEQNNFCGLGVCERGQRGHSFATVEEGVTAMIQHLYAYACSEALPAGEVLIDPRFKYVSRGCAPTWFDLSGRWAMNSSYGMRILDLYRMMSQHDDVPVVSSR